MKQFAFDVAKRHYSADEFGDYIKDTMQNILYKFHEKNAQYGGEDIFSQIREEAERMSPENYEVTVDKMVNVILSHKDKHDVSMLRHGTDLSDFSDRAEDIIIYVLMANFLYQKASY